jgi:hypothetical protein
MTPIPFKTLAQLNTNIGSSDDKDNDKDNDKDKDKDIDIDIDIDIDNDHENYNDDNTSNDNEGSALLPSYAVRIFKVSLEVLEEEMIMRGILLEDGQDGRLFLEEVQDSVFSSEDRTYFIWYTSFCNNGLQATGISTQIMLKTTKTKDATEIATIKVILRTEISTSC